MKHLLNAIQNAFNNNYWLASNFANGLEVSVPADAEAMPLCVMTVYPATTEFQTSGPLTAWEDLSLVDEYNVDEYGYSDVAITPTPSPYIETVKTNITVYHTDPTFVQSAETYLDLSFNRIPFPIEVDYLMFNWRSGGGNPYRDSDDARVWRADYQYSFKIQRKS